MSHHQRRPHEVSNLTDSVSYQMSPFNRWDPETTLYENAKSVYKYSEPSDVLKSGALDQAIDYANLKYKGLYRKATSRVPAALPYIVHPMDVMQRVANLGIHDIDTLTAALLHDLLEDTDVQASCLEDAFGAQVRRLVEAMTHDKDKDSKSEYLDNLCTFEIAALIIKLADRASNVESFKYGNPDYAGLYAQKAESIYRSVLGRREEIQLHFGRHVCANATNLANELLNF